MLVRVWSKEVCWYTTDLTLVFGRDSFRLKNIMRENSHISHIKYYRLRQGIVFLPIAPFVC